MTENITVIYNDTCPICSREVDGYRRMTAGEGTDVAYAGLSDGAYAAYGLSKAQAAREFHVVKGGRMLSGVPAFAALWSEIPRLRWLARLVSLPGVHWLACIVYDHVLAPALYLMHKRRQRRLECASGDASGQ